MISQSAIIAWQNVMPWAGTDQIEHDLILTRAISELYNNDIIARNLIFRGGTALHKLFLEKAGRFSEDLDFVQVAPGPIGDTVKAIRDCLDHWLGCPSWKQNHGRFTLYYRFKTELEPVVTRKVKIEINTREHHQFITPISRNIIVNNPWYTGGSDVVTYSIEELMATKLRALYQRKKGRDLFDFWFVVRQIPELDVGKIIEAFKFHMNSSNISISRAEYEMNMFDKKNDPVFRDDIFTLLSSEEREKYKFDQAYNVLLSEFVSKLPGDPWKGSENY